MCTMHIVLVMTTMRGRRQVETKDEEVVDVDSDSFPLVPLGKENYYLLLVVDM